PYDQLMADCAAILALACEAAGRTRLSWREAAADPFVEPERVTLAEAFDRHAGIDLLATIAASGETDRDDLARRTRAAGI
uniref:hypothetical protein n=1 Tax=Stenotrophomonas maltophilia TaxID=40324 RepID=UPI001954C5D1